MNGVSQTWGSDIEISAAGGLAEVDGVPRSQQRILRRLLTTRGAYIFHPDYGAGLGAWVGAQADVRKLKATIKEQLFLEESVSRTPVPVVDITQDFRTLRVQITYVESETNRQTALSFSVDE